MKFNVSFIQVRSSTNLTTEISCSKFFMCVHMINNDGPIFECFSTNIALIWFKVQMNFIQVLFECIIS
ncbi:CLUMA_CG000588, isoform A [Clunio marinus]|uniref:CLUMA_CG000588, isoform A n=1 Tax=Clunio marinus TaxID=568069 RepID=A0A1J1HH64_9DIPT|nr:CLUMA_CG000588, isoform A [Clunio marinus]